MISSWYQVTAPTAEITSPPGVFMTAPNKKEFVGLFHFPPIAASFHGLLVQSLPPQHTLDEHRCTVSETSEVAGVPRKGSANCLSTVSQLLKAEIHGTKCLSVTEDLCSLPSCSGIRQPLPCGLISCTSQITMQSTVGNTLTNYGECQQRAKRTRLQVLETYDQPRD